MQMKKVVSLIMVLVMMLTLAVIPGTFSAQTVDAADTAAASNDYALAPDIQSGNILHAFNWRMRDLVKYADEIAAAGYTSVQISPIQATKVTANDGSYATDWWSFYQPTDMTIGNALGTAAELKEATDALHKVGVKVIADVVTNHVQNCTSRAESNLVAATLRSTSTGARHSLTTHPMVTSDNSRQAQVQGDMGGQLPDMNTGLKSYQNYVIDNLLIPLADNGVDGYRFDAAKHIETPDDGSYASDYWPTVTSAIKNKNSDAYIYGEVLATGGRFQITSYTKYINVTDYAFGNSVRAALNSKNASNLVNYGYSGSSKSQNVLWVESHDNFCDYTSTSLTKKQQILGWAVVGSRAEAPALFFVRPKHEALDSDGFIKYDELMGAPGAADTWKDPTVVAVNKFKNAFAGQSETASASGANLFVQRGTTGMVIVNLNGSSASISQNCSMASGSYTDQVSGKTFQVSGGKITGTVGSTGVAVIYNTTADNSAPEVKLSLNNVELTPEVLSRYTAATATVKVDLKNATSATIKVSNLEAKTVTGSTTFTLNSTIPYGKSVDITVTTTNGKKTVERTFNIKKKDPNETKKVYFDNSSMKWPMIYAFCKTGVSPSTKIAAYDAYQMTGDINGIVSYTVPSNTKYVKFNEGYIGPEYTDKQHVDAYGRCHLFHSFSECGGYCGRTMPETVVNYGTANSAANRENGGYELVGAMIMRDLRFEDYGDYPVATLAAADTSLTSGEVQPTEAPQPTTPEPTVAPEPTQPVGRKLLLGDADQDTLVSILDATMMQRHLAYMITLTDDGVLCADIDKNERLESIDVTLLQRYLANMGNPYNVDQYFYVDGVEPTEAPEPTQAQELVKLSNKFVVTIYCEAAGTDDASRNSEHALDEYGRLTYNFQGPSYVFARNYDTGVQYATNGWSNFQNPVTLVNEKDLTATFDKMYVPMGEHTLYLQPGEGDTFILGYDTYDSPITVEPTTSPNPDPDPTTPIESNDVTFEPGDASVADPAWFAWVWNDGSAGHWVKGTVSGSNIIFATAADYDNMLVARMPTGSTEGDWSKCWNQSEDIAVQQGKTLYFTGWGSGNKFLIGWK